MSGLSRTPGKRVWANTHRGFESRPLRQIKYRPLWAVFYLDRQKPCGDKSRSVCFLHEPETKTVISFYRGAIEADRATHVYSRPKAKEPSDNEAITQSVDAAGQGLNTIAAQYADY